MPSDPRFTQQPNSVPKPVPGLPTVTPPSGTMFLRLFGVPALIVGGVVILLIVAQPLIGTATKFLIGRAWGASRTPEQFLNDIKSTNTEVRWRAANDLAQVLLRDDALASDGNFALQLNQELRKALDSSDPAEAIYAERSAKLKPDEEARELKKLEDDRKYILLLTQCLGHFMVPVGAGELEKMALRTSGLDPRARNARRRQALWALANLGQNLKRFDDLSTEKQESVKAQLEMAVDSGDPSGSAKAALDYLVRRQKGDPSVFGVDEVVVKCADADDPSLRELAAFVVNFWSGTAAENARMEKTLLRLCDDPGKGEDELAKLEDENAQEETRKLVKKPGFRVQVNAAIALARMGSKKVRLGLLQTMLDQEELRSIFVVQTKKGGAERADEAAVVETMRNALKAVAELHHKQPQFDLSSLRQSVDKLALNPNPAVQAEAAKVVLDQSK